jgi:predicted small secreted protein
MLSTTYNSPLATSVTGNAKDVVTTTLGWLLFPGFVATAKSVFGISVSFLGAFLYSYINLQKSRARDAALTVVKSTASAETPITIASITPQEVPAQEVATASPVVEVKVDAEKVHDAIARRREV